MRRCAGTHVHFEQLPGREIDQLNLLTALDPALALVNSSPFFEGSRLAASSRPEVYRWRAYDSLPYQGQLWSYAEDTEEWATRLQRRYEEFVTEAVMMGFDVSAFEPLTREFDTHGDLSPERTRELRLAFADRLAEEVRANRPVSAD